MPLKCVLHWHPNAGTTANTQIVNEVSQCVESISGVIEGRWKATLNSYKPMVREQSRAAEFPRDFLGISLLEQPKQVLFHDLGSKGFEYQLGDFQLRVGKVVPSHSGNLRGIVMEVEYLSISSMDKARQIMEEFVDIWLEAISKRSLRGHFLHIEPNFAKYGSWITILHNTRLCSVLQATVVA
ncbi:hypothetical protein P3X46_027859 [Hevea brasiliensis]|uniref:Mediator of RNA polymerase II transcription subunit 20 n=1 Tax=Hevea brasiliensis TaxID=3981 RepID=A0ABQ9L4P2_HEVBR|nr:hypothetical protein P3X46_027859 [Hevea brasiliensis]